MLPDELESIDENQITVNKIIEYKISDSTMADSLSVNGDTLCHFKDGKLVERQIVLGKKKQSKGNSLTTKQNEDSE